VNALEVELIEDVARFYDNPVGFVKYIFPWGSDSLANETGMDKWQEDTLNSIAEAIKSGSSIGDAIRLAIASGHGIGKTALVAWVILWFISTREFPQIVVTSNTQAQLSSKTWRELAKWHRLAINKHWFEWTATRFYHKEYPDTWFASAIPWSINNSEAFAGTHEKHVLVVYDEASGIHDMIWEVTEGAMTTSGAMWIAFGNPTKNTGRFRECFGKFKHRWITRQIDSREAKQANAKQIQQWIDDYGEDSDFVRVRVRGVFPRSGSNQFIGAEIIEECRKYKAEGYEGLERLLAVDVARFGDDQSVILLRQGRKVSRPIKYRGLDTMQLASRVVEQIDEVKPDAVFIDGVGVGAGVVDRVKQLRPSANIIEVNAGQTANDSAKYYNKRAEMWGLTRDFLKAGAELPDDNEMAEELQSVEYGFSVKQQIQIEKKEDMKSRGLSSPDNADALCLTFAEKIIRNEEQKHEEYYGVGDANGWMA
jgi:hypothetical protein